MLDDFEARLRRYAIAEEAEKDAAAHGLHCWQQAFQLREVAREWGHLHLCLLDELEGYALAHPECEREILPIARRMVVQLCIQGVGESATDTANYTRLRPRGTSEIWSKRWRTRMNWNTGVRNCGGKPCTI
ncbi:MAG: hypothetical protein M3120_05615 [Pseudomonadota bacterium]|nr:hypothetical protein [Pseudomonadota bacterium]